MNYLETARNFVCAMIAVALSMTVSAVASLLPHRPDWLERVENLAITLRAAGHQENVPSSHPSKSSSAADISPAPGANDPGFDIDQGNLLLAYNELWEFVQGIRSDGLALDDGFCDRIEREWSVSTLLTYFRNADKSLQETASKRLDEAASLLAAKGGAE